MSEIQECKTCLFSIEDNITDFYVNTDTGICNYCATYHKRPKLNNKADHSEDLLKKIKSVKGKYNCILGLSGGTDSSYMALWAYENKLNPLVVHMDNGWNSRESVENVERICDQFNFALQTLVLPWETFRQMQVAYLKAGVVDIEVITDHAIYATLRKIAKQYKLKYVLSGYNNATEFILPKNWYYNAKDFDNIQDICKKHGNHINLSNYPKIEFSRLIKDKLFGPPIEFLTPLEYLDYNINSIKNALLKAVPGYYFFPGKHNESLITRFYQEYILPTKFKINKKKAHLSNLVCSGQMSREEAVLIMQKDYYNPSEIAELKAYFIKKLALTEAEFNQIMSDPTREHSDYKTNERKWNWFYKIQFRLRKIGLLKK